MISIGFFGECMVELSEKGMGYSGDTYNTALYLSRLDRSYQFSVSYISAIGTDKTSMRMLDSWRSEGIDIGDVLQFSDKNLGSYTITTDRQGERHFSYDRDHSAARDYFRPSVTPFEVSLASDKFDYVYLSGISLAILTKKHRERLLAALAEFKQRGGKIIFDNNFRPSLWGDDNPRDYYQKIMALTHIALLTDDDEYAIYGESQPHQILERCHQLHINEVVIKRGNLPCIVATSDEQMIEVEPRQIDQVIDTCAAGDSFAAGYLYQRLLDNQPAQAAEYGHQLAGEVIQHPGAIIPKNAMPTIAV